MHRTHKTQTHTSNMQQTIPQTHHISSHKTRIHTKHNMCTIDTHNTYHRHSTSSHTTQKTPRIPHICTLNTCGTHTVHNCTSHIVVTYQARRRVQTCAVLVNTQDNIYTEHAHYHRHITYAHVQKIYTRDMYSLAHKARVCVYMYVCTHHHASQPQYLYTQHTHVDGHKRDFSGGPVVKSSCQRRRQGSRPWSGKIPHARELLSPCTTATEPHALKAVLHDKRSRRNEKPTHRN